MGWCGRGSLAQWVEMEVPLPQQSGVRVPRHGSRQLMEGREPPITSCFGAIVAQPGLFLGAQQVKKGN